MRIAVDEAAPALALVLQNKPDTEPVAYACGTCHVVKTSEQDARECCAPRYCDTCGQRLTEKFSGCFPCGNKEFLERLEARKNRSRQVTVAAYTGPDFFFDARDSECVGGFDDVLLLVEEHGPEGRAWYWGSVEVQMQLDAQDIIDQLYNTYELDDDSSPEDFFKPEALQAIEDFVKDFNTRFSNVCFREEEVVVDFTQDPHWQEAVAAYKKENESDVDA